jgi:putative peptidoglycan lipid II flippase
MAISTAALPSLATLAAKGHKEELAKTYAHGMRLALFVALPASVALAFLGEPLVAMLFQRGHFDAGASIETARSLFWQGGAIWTVAAVRQLVPVFYALGDTRTPVIVSAIDLISFIVIAFALKGPMGHAGISAAVAGSSFVQMVLLFYGLKRRLGTVCGREIAVSALRTLLASVVAGASAWALARLLVSPVSRGVVASVVFTGVFLVAAWGARSEELEGLIAGAQRRLGRISIA